MAAATRRNCAASVMDEALGEQFPMRPQMLADDGMCRRFKRTGNAPALQQGRRERCRHQEADLLGVDATRHVDADHAAFLV